MLFLLMLVSASSPISSQASTQDICARAAENSSAVREAQYGFSDDAFAKEFLLSKEERVDVACQLKKGILRQYSALHLKQERLGIQPVAHLDQCILDEAKLSEDTRLRFVDRMKKCIATFQDTHMGVSARIQIPGIFTGITTSLVNGKVIITGRSPKLLNYIGTKDFLDDYASSLPLGAEILEVDGVPVLEKVREFLPYISASGQKARQDWATSAVFARSFAYPSKNSMEVKVRLPKGEEKLLRMPWFRSGKANNSVDANRELKKLGIPSLDNLSWVYDPIKQKWSSTSSDFEGYDSSEALFPNTVEWLDSSDSSVAYRTGEVLLDRKRVFCYLQILTFSVDSVKSGTVLKPFLDPIEEFVASCERKQLPMIMDLRSNGGGVASYPEQIFTFLAKKGESYLTRALALRATKHSMWMLSQMEDDRSTGAKVYGSMSLYEKLGPALVDAISKKQAHTDVLVGPPLKAKGDGYSQNIVALISPDCISACDNMAMLLKNNKRATLIGLETNGTGAGFQSMGRMNSNFTDTSQILSVQIPTTLFGAVKNPTAEGSYPFAQGKEWITENRPTIGDVPYDLTEKDILEKGAGWREKALESLFQEDGGASTILTKFRSLW